MAYRKTETTATTTTNTKEKETNKFYLNLGVTLADGTFVRLSTDNSIVVSLDKFMTQKKNINKDSNWANHQLIRNAVIAELEQVFGDMKEGTSMNVNDTNSKVLPRITFELSKAGSGTVSEDSIPDEQTLDNLLGL